MNSPKNSRTPPSFPSGGKDSDRGQYFPEDERSPMDEEDDHSYTDFDLSREIEAKLGAVAEERRESPSVADTAPPRQPDDVPPLPSGSYFPEDERFPMEGEDDHSFTDFDLDAEIDAALARRKAETPFPAGKDGAPPPEDERSGGVSEDERSPSESEDDHSYADFDPDREIEARCGPAGETLGESWTGSDPEPVAGEDGREIDASARAEAAKNREALHVDDDSRCHEEPEDSGDDDDGLCAPLPMAEGACPAGNMAAGEASGSDSADGMAPEPGKDESAAGRTFVSPDAGGGSGGNGGAAAGGDASGAENGEGKNKEEEGEKEEDRPMTLRDHLNELRKRLFRAFLWAVLGFFFCYPFAERLFILLFAPLTEVMPASSKLIYTSPPEAFFTFMKVAFVAGIFASSPMVFYQIWAFIAPGLYKEEKIYVLPVAVFSAIFFICGGSFCYFVVFPFAFSFFMSYNQGLIQAMPGLSETLSFVLQLLLAFGLIFELPLFVFFLARLGIVTADFMRRFRRYAILGNVILAAILTPPDVMSQLFMAAPLLLLYELSILIAATCGRKKAKPEEEEEESKATHENGGRAEALSPGKGAFNE